MILSLSVFLLISLFDYHIIANDLDNNEVNISKLSDSSFVVFYKSPSCHNCMIELGKAISDLKYKKYAVIQSKDDFYVKVELKNKVGKYIKFDEYYFENLKSPKKIISNNFSLFNKFNVVNTPAILIYTSGKIKYITFEKLFLNYYDEKTIKNEIIRAINAE